MSSKNNPGSYDCYANAAPDEPMFVLLGRDPMAPLLVTLWAEMRRRDGEDAAKVKEAEACAVAMALWARSLGKEARVDDSGALLGRVFAEMFAGELKDGDL